MTDWTSAGTAFWSALVSGLIVFFLGRRRRNRMYSQCCVHAPVHVSRGKNDMPICRLRMGHVGPHEVRIGTRVAWWL